MWTFGNGVESFMKEAMDNTAFKSDAQKRGAGENALRQMLGLPKKYANPALSRHESPPRERPFKE